MSEKDRIALDVEEIHFNQPIPSGQFERYIAGECARIEAAVDRVIAAAGLRPGQIDHHPADRRLLGDSLVRSHAGAQDWLRQGD